LPTLFGVLVVAFLLLNVAPGDPVAAMVGERADSATIARLRAELHLDDPLPAQFGHYVWGVLRGDLGRSYITQRPIVQDLEERFPKTVQLALAAMLLAALCGISVGAVAAVRPGGAFDRLAMLVSYLGVSFPVYWVGLLLILVFALELHWLPPSGSGGLAYLVLPALTLGMRSIAFLSRITRAAMLDVLSSDFVRTARAKGLSEAAVVLRHGLRNAPAHRGAARLAGAPPGASGGRAAVRPRHVGDVRGGRPRPRAVPTQRRSFLRAGEQHQARRHRGRGGAAAGGLPRDDEPVRE